MKKKYTFKIGDRVCASDDENSEQIVPLKYNPYAEPAFGIIVAELPTGKVTVKWDRDFYNDYYDNDIDPSILVSEEEGKSKLSVLEKDFFEMCKLIEKDMEEAAALIKKANKLAVQSGFELGNLDVNQPLISAMDAAGWRSSSWGC